MNREKFINEYGFLLKGAFVEGFGLESQFPILEFRNEEQNLNIKFHTDCRITTNDAKTNEAVEALKSINKEVYILAYFFAVNLKTVEDKLFLSNGSLALKFQENFQLIFHVIGEWSEPLNISIVKEGEPIYGVRIFGDGTIGK